MPPLLAEPFLFFTIDECLKVTKTKILSSEKKGDNSITLSAQTALSLAWNVTPAEDLTPFRCGALWYNSEHSLALSVGSES
ncbi:hypothetical protein [Erwinia sp.]|uniref:hypothetical protein n=1 Tax=Erwinia citreus TaxID=558 RepID=UPI003C72DAF8